MRIEKLKEYLDYDPETGNFIWKVHTGWASPGKPAGCKTKKGYIQIGISLKSYYAHKLAWLFVHGKYPKGEIDHINGNKADNRITNLRDVTVKENQRNASLRKDNSSGFVGVCFYKKTGEWCAYIKVDGKRIHLGNFVDKELAILARKKANKKYGFHKNHGRNSEDV